MMKEVNVSVRNGVILAYEECQVLLQVLRQKSREERFVEYERFSSLLFPKKGGVPVDLEDQLSNREDYRRKFREWFLLVGNDVLCGWRRGECCFSKYRDRKKEKSRGIRYPQKVILALGMMGYLTGIKTKYSNSGTDRAHGYIYNVDDLKLTGWDESLTRQNVEVETDWESCSEWNGKMQYETICSMSVAPGYVQDATLYQNAYESFVQSYTLGEKEYYNTDIISITNPLLSIANGDTYKMIRHKTDDYGGRYYTILTNMSGEMRRSCLTISGAPLCEVDVSSAQPTFLGLLLKEKYPDVCSEWLSHCLDGTFYEWLNQITGIFPDSEFQNQGRATIKKWTMRYLYSTNQINDEPKSWKTAYKHFEYKLNQYLFQNERELFSIFYDFKTHLSIVERDTPTKSGSTTKKRNDLSRELTKIEVKYIKQCLASLPPDIKYFYTIHDCIGCLESDAERVKSVMEDVSRDMFGVTLRLKVEFGNPDYRIPSFDPTTAVVKKGKKQKNGTAS